MNSTKVDNNLEIFGNLISVSKYRILLCVAIDGADRTGDTQRLFNACVDVFELRYMLDLYGRILVATEVSISVE